MTVKGRKIQMGWLALFIVMLGFSILGLFATPRAGQFDMANEHLYANVAWMITATIFVLMMTPGLSFFYGGMVKVKNVISTMLQSFIVMGFVSVIWVVFGFGLAFGNDVWHIIGNPADFFMFDHVGVDNVTNPDNPALSQIGLATTTIPLALFALFQMKFAIITPSLITGSFAERVRFSAYLLFMALWVVVVYCPLAHCTWHPEGLFGMMDVHDFAGGIVVHAASGIAALAGALFLGKRRPSKDAAKPANVPYVLLGAALLWLGWFGFNGGSSLAADGIAVSAFLNTNTAAATAMITWVVIDAMRGHKPSAMGAAIGAVVGLVAITPCAGWVTVGQSIFISFAITICCNLAVAWKGYSHMLDDALDVFPTHGLGGILGTVLTGIFAYDFFASQNPDIISHWHFFWNHIIVLLIVFAYTFGMSYALYWITNKIIPMRVSRHSEEVGLDKSQHDEEYGPEAGTGIVEDDSMSISDWYRKME
ncbi:MAG: ammonium transporter [Bacteroidales bacterium]|nr:ammonium transporter [Bacteroidales bacterium]